MERFSISPKVNVVEIPLQNLIFREGFLNSDGEQNLAYFSGVFSLPPEVDVPRQLLRQSACRAKALSHQNRLANRPGETDDVNPPVRIKPPVFDSDEGTIESLRHLYQRNEPARRAFFIRKLVYQFRFKIKALARRTFRVADADNLPGPHRDLNVPCLRCQTRVFKLAQMDVDGAALFGVQRRRVFPRRAQSGNYLADRLVFQALQLI